MPATLRTRLAVSALVGVFLIPIGLSSMRGLTHLISCREQVISPFEVTIGDGQAVITGGTEVGAGEADGVCGGITVDLRADVDAEGRVEVTIPISNHTGADWYGSVQLEVAGTRVPVDLGRVDAGETRRRSIVLRLPDGTTRFGGLLLVGP